MSGLGAVIDAVSGALAPFFPSDDPPTLDIAELTEPDDELGGILLAEGAKPKMVVGRLKGKDTTTVQTIVFPKDAYPNVEACKAWLDRNGLSAGKVDETADSYRYRQRDPGDFEQGSFRTITPGEKKANEDDDTIELAEITHTQEFLSEFRRLVTEMAKNGPLSDAELMDCMKKARAHAGGMTASKNRQMRDSALTEPIMLNEFTWGVELGEVGKPIQIMKTGDFDHPEFGKFSITPEDIAEIKANFDAGVRGQDLPIDVDHIHEGGAVGWMKSLSIKGETLWATPEWDDTETVRKFRYISPHFGPYQDNEGKKHRVVLMSAAVTNFPFLKNMEPISLSEFASRKGGKAMGVTVEDLEKRLSETEAKATAEASEREKLLTEAAERETKLNEQVKELTERQARMEHDGMVKRLTERIRGGGDPNKRIIGDETKKVAVVLKLAETFGEDSEEVTTYLEDQEATSAMVRESGALRETGSTRSGHAGDALDQFEAALREVQEKSPSLDRGAATAKLLSERPELYAAYDKQMVRSNN